MQTLETAPVSTDGVRAGRENRPPRRRVSLIGLIGELLLTAGALVLLYVVWQLWVGDLIYGAQASAEGQSTSQEWAQEYAQDHDLAPEAPSSADSFVEPPLLDRPADAESFALMRIPRFGADYFFDIAGGTTRARTLDTTRIGHYTGAAMPGQVGNFAVAAHRTTFGAPFKRLADLRLGDAIVVETREGWYTYRFRTHEYVEPREVDVLRDVPQQPEAPPGERYLTMTSCSPMGSLAERIVAYGIFEGYTPRSAGPPASLAAPPG